MRPAIISADAISSLDRWYVACGLKPDDSGEYRVKRNDVPQPKGVKHEQNSPTRKSVKR